MTPPTPQAAAEPTTDWRDVSKPPAPEIVPAWVQQRRDARRAHRDALKAAGRCTECQRPKTDTDLRYRLCFRCRLVVSAQDRRRKETRA